MEEHNGEEGDKEDQEEDIEKRENVILAVELTGRHQNQPLETDHKLDQDTEEEEENLVQGGEVNTGVERDEEHLLDQDGGVNKDIGDTCAKPNSNASDITILDSIGKSYN